MTRDFLPPKPRSEVSGKPQATGDNTGTWVGGWQEKGESRIGKATFGFGFSLKSFISAVLPAFDVRFSRVAGFALSKATGISQRMADTKVLCLALCIGTEDGLCFNLVLSWLLTPDRLVFWLLTKQLCCFRNGRLLGVCASVDNCRLFVGGIPKTKKREEILAEMKKVTDGVVDVIVYPSAADKTKNRGFAFVEYESHRAAAMARRKLLPGEQGWGGVTMWGHHQGIQESKEVNVAGFSAIRQQFSALRQQFSARHTQSLEAPQHTVGCGIHCSSCCNTVLVIHGCPSGAWDC